MAPVQDAILRQDKLVATLEGDKMSEAAAALQDMRKTDKLIRDRLFVLQVWRKHGYETSNKLYRRMTGEYEDAHLNKILEEKEKREEKAKREREKERDRARTQAYNFAKRPRFNGPQFSRGGAAAQYNVSPMVQAYGQHRGFRGGFSSGYRGGARGFQQHRDTGNELKCFICNDQSHFWKDCPNKK